MKKDSILFLIATIIFGTNGIVARYINVSSFFLVTCRGLIASLFIGLVYLIRGKKINWEAIKNNSKCLILSGIVLGFMWLFLYVGYTYVVSISSLLNNMAPVFVVIISAILFKEKISSKQILCVVFAIIGVLLVSGVFEGQIEANIHAFIYGFLSMVCFCANILLNKKMVGVDPLDRTLIQIFISFIINLLGTLFLSQIPSSIDTLSLVLILVIGILNTGVAYILFYDSITSLPTYKIAIIGYLEPVIAIILSIVVLHENITTLGIIGSIIIIISACAIELIDNK